MVPSWLPLNLSTLPGPIPSDNIQKSKDFGEVNFKSNLSNGSGSKCVSHKFTLKVIQLNLIKLEIHHLPIKTQNPPFQ